MAFAKRKASGQPPTRAQRSGTRFSENLAPSVPRFVGTGWHCGARTVVQVRLQSDLTRRRTFVF